jgi:peptidoglycan/xylan/chitin deacetylase (PgdA/CDA1 family)
VAHGWEHENLSQLTFDEQKVRLLDAKEHLDKLFNTETEILVPPMFGYNNYTIQAMKETGYRIVSGLSEFHNKGWASGEIMSLPATIELSDYSNESWHMKTRSIILNEVENSIETHGYAMIVTHPQEFMKNGDLDPETTTKFGQILQKLSEKFSFTTIDEVILYLQQDLVNQIY